MTEEIIGEIVASQMARLPKTDKQYGFITIETSENLKYRFKVDTSTEYDTVERGETVAVHYDQLGSTDILAAKYITKK
jgi:hypothetical protein